MNQESTVTAEISELTELAYEGSIHPLTTTPVVGSPGVTYADVLVPGAEDLAPDEVRSRFWAAVTRS